MHLLIFAQLYWFFIKEEIIQFILFSWVFLIEKKLLIDTF